MCLHRSCLLILGIVIIKKQLDTHTRIQVNTNLHYSWVSLPFLGNVSETSVMAMSWDCVSYVT